MYQIVNVLLYYDYKTVDQQRVDNFKQMVETNHDIFMRDISKFRANHLEQELRKNQVVFLLYDKQLETKLTEGNEPFYQMIYTEFLETRENIRYFKRFLILK